MGSITPQPSLPLIDLSKFTSQDATQADRLTVARELVEACHTTGFVYITNHGISPELLAKIFAYSKSFFALTTEQKMQAKHPEGSMSFRGYNWPGLLSTAALIADDHPDTDKNADAAVKEATNFTESYDTGSDENPDDLNIWLPEATLPGLRALDTEFYWACWSTSQVILRALALGLGFEDEDFLLQFHSGHENEVSLRHYPEVPESVIASEKMRRLGAHTDFDSFTLLFQDDCGGLEVQKAGCPGEFLEAGPVEGALVMNIGDILMRWSNDYLVSTIHRVHLPPLQDRYIGEERMTRERYSIPYFVAPKRNVLLECLPKCHSEENPPKYAPVTFNDLFTEKFAQAFAS